MARRTPALSLTRTWSLQLSFNTALSAHRPPACSLLDASVRAPSLVGRQTCTAALYSAEAIVHAQVSSTVSAT
jgi:hypothetical protein